MTPLIEGLPDAVAIRCLALVPFYLHPKLELVSHSWRAAIRSAELFKARHEVNSSEELLCVSAFEPRNLWQLYDPTHDLWITLPILPSNISHFAGFSVVSTSGKLFVLGGGSDAVGPLTGDQDGGFATDKVWSYDPATRAWSLRASMLVPRAMFACCVLDGKIIVAGGFTNRAKSICNAEIYDPETDVWVQLPDLHHTHNSACSGVILGGKVHVLHKGLSTIQVLENFKQGWIPHECSWLQGPMTVSREKVYVASNRVIYMYEGRSRFIFSPSDFPWRIGYAMIVLGDDIYIVGGDSCPNFPYRDFKLVSDVDVMTLGSWRPAWRKVAPMTRCRGTILGCTQLRI